MRVIDVLIPAGDQCEIEMVDTDGNHLYTGTFYQMPCRMIFYEIVGIGAVVQNEDYMYIPRLWLKVKV